MNALTCLRLTATAAVLVAALTPSLHARERNRQRTVTRTNAAGETTVHQRNLSADPAAGTADLSATTTLADGRTAGRMLSSVRTETGRSTTGSATTFNGRTATYGSERVRTEDGYTRAATATGPNGQTATRDVTVTQGDDTRTRTTTTTGPNGATSTVTTTRTRTP